MYNTPFPTQPVVQTLAPPPSYPPVGPGGAKRSWPRLALLVGAVIVLASVLPATLPKAVSAARKSAYPKPAITVKVATGGAQTFHTGDQVSFSVDVQSGKNLTFNWNINGQTYTGATVTTTFDQPGQETAHVTATDPIGQSADAETSVNVLPPAPTACFTASADAFSSYYFDFDASCSTGQIQQYTWNFGDGGTDTSFSSSDYHDYYPSTGPFTVTLTVTDSYNQSDTTTQTITVTGQ